jgi:hypothetical protein
MSVEKAIDRRCGRLAEIICCAAAIVLFGAAAKAQTPQPMPPGPAMNPERPPLTPVDEADETFSFLRDSSKRSDFWDPLKYVPLDSNGDSYLT